MNVLIIPSFFYDKYNPTSGSFFLEQAQALQKKGHNVFIAYCDTYSVKQFDRWFRYSEKNEEKAGIPVYRKRAFCPLKHGSGFYGCHERFAKEIIKLYEAHLADKKIDIIHAHCCAWAGYAAMKLSEKTGIPYVITEHSSLYSLKGNQIRGRYRAALEESFRNAKKVICVSGALKEVIKPFAQNIEIIGNVINCNLFHCETVKRNTDEMRFLTVLHMNHENQIHNKGMDLLLNSFSEVTKQCPTARLLIGGDGSARKNLESWISERNLADKVIMLGGLSRQEVARQMQQCDVFVLPSRYETFGVVYAEAMACGKPVIATRTGGPDSFVTEQTGILIDVEDQEQLTQAMLYMAENHHKYDSKKIRAHIEDLFSMDAVARQLEEIYRKIV